MKFVVVPAALLITSLFFATDKPAPVKPVTAVSTSEFLNSIGVNSAISSRGEKLDKTVEAIKYTGIRWIRSGYEGNVSLDDYKMLHRETGVKFSYGLMSGGTDIMRLLKDARVLADDNALLAFEGNNEPNNWTINYQGKKSGKNESWVGVAQLQSDLYKSVKADEALKKYPVWNLTEGGAQTDNTGLQYLTIPEGANTVMPAGTRYADYATCHNYFSHPSHKGLYDNQTWNAADPGPLCKVDGLYGNYSKTWAHKFAGYSEQQLINLPKVTTETGVTIQDDFTEEKQARLYLNLYLAQFKRSWSYTAVYLLRDRSDEQGNQSFGFYQKDYTPRKAAVYLHNLTTILADKGGRREPGKLAYTINDQPETVHDLLLQNGNGKYQLVIWDEKASGTDSIKVSFANLYGHIMVFDPTVSETVQKHFNDVTGMTLTLSDHPVVIEFD